MTGILRYLPRSNGTTGYYEVTTKEPVTIKESNKKCTHPNTSYFNYIDKRASDMARYYGQCCVTCGFITEGQKLT